MGHIVLRLDRVMADRKMSLNELSEKVGVANVNLSKMKNGRISAIRFSTLAAICEALHCQPGDILEYDPDGEPQESPDIQGKSFCRRRQPLFPPRLPEHAPEAGAVAVHTPGQRDSY